MPLLALIALAERINSSVSLSQILLETDLQNVVKCRLGGGAGVGSLLSYPQSM